MLPPVLLNLMSTSPDQFKATVTIIWLAIIIGLCFMLQFLGGGFSSLLGELHIRSYPLLLVGIIPLAIGMVGKMILLPQAKSDQTFQTILIVSLALCETPAMMSFFVFPPEMTTEKSFAFLGSVIGSALLCPLLIDRSQPEP